MRLTRSAAMRGHALDEEDKRPGVHLAAPVPVAPIAAAVLEFADGRLTRLTWQPVAGASHYAVEVDYCVPRRGSSCALTVPYYREDMFKSAWQDSRHLR